MRLEPKPDDTLEGLINGHRDWRRVVNYWDVLSLFENGMGYRVPGTYHALKRAANGLKDPVTGEFNGISAAYDIQGVLSYLPPDQQATLLQPATGTRQERAPTK